MSIETLEPSVIFKVGGNEYRSASGRRSSAPKWSESFELECPDKDKAVVGFFRLICFNLLVGHHGG